MQLRPIRNKREYHAALKEAELLWNAPDGSPAADRLEVLALLIEAYERKGHHIGVFDCLVIGEDGTRLVHMRHTTIFRIAPQAEPG